VSAPLGNNENPVDGPAPSGAKRALDDARLDALLNAFFDKELGADESGDLFKGLRKSPKKAREFAATRRMVEDLRAPVHAPDLTRDILAAVHQRRPWLRDRDVWGVRLGRLGLVAALLLVLGGVLLQRRATPDAPVWNAGPAPLTELVRSSSEATQRTRHDAQAAIASIRADASLFGVAPRRAATVVSFKPSLPELAQVGDRYSVSRKPDETRCAGFRSARSTDRDVLLLRLSAPGAVGAANGQGEYASTVVTFRPR